MKWNLAIALGLILAAPAWGQHAGSVGHAASAAPHAGSGYTFSHSFAPPSAPRSSSYPSTPQRSQQHSAQYNSPIGAPPLGGSYPYHYGNHNDHDRDRYRASYSQGVYVVPSFLNYGLYDYGYAADYGSDQQAPPPEAPAQEAAAPSGENQRYGEQAYVPVPARPEYQPQAQALEIPAQPELTLLFKDGRPPQQVQNYALTQTTLYVLDGSRRREIPLDQLDLPETEKTNRDAGLDFQVPAGAE